MDFEEKFWIFFFGIKRKLYRHKLCLFVWWNFLGTQNKVVKEFGRVGAGWIHVAKRPLMGRACFWLMGLGPRNT